MGVWCPFLWGGNMGSVAGRLFPARGLSRCIAGTTRLYSPETTEKLDCSERRCHKMPVLGMQDESAQPTVICGLRFCALWLSVIVHWSCPVTAGGFCCPYLPGTLYMWEGYMAGLCALYLMYCIGHLLLQAKAVHVLKFLIHIGHLYISSLPSPSLQTHNWSSLI